MTRKPRAAGIIPIDKMETFARGRRIKLLIELGDDDDPDGKRHITEFLVAVLEDAALDGFHQAEVDMLLVQKDN